VGFPRRRCCAPFPGYGVCSPGKRSATGEMAARLTAKHKNKRPGLSTEPFVYVAMTAAFPGGGAAHLFRATVFVAPVSAAPPGKMAVRLTAKHKNKRPSLSTEPFALFDAWQFPTLTWGDPTLPSALRRFTSEFGMGSGGTTALSPPGKFCFQHVLRTHRVICIRLKIFSNPPKHLRRCKVKPHGSLVSVSSTYRYAYTPDLSTSSSLTFLQETYSLRENSSRGKFRA
jgi:hypothetical protein